MSNAVAFPKPRPISPREQSCAVQVVTRVTRPSRDTIKALAEAEGLTIQQLGLYAWSLALQAYGQPPLPEATS